MRLRLLSLLCTSALVLPLAACGESLADGDDGAANEGVEAEITALPSVVIDDEGGTDVRVPVLLTHFGGPDAETLEVVSASLNLDLEHYADIELAIPSDHAPFPGLAMNEEFEFRLQGSIPDNHDDWGLCGVADEADDELRVTLNLALRVTPGANDDEDDFEYESLAVDLSCSHTG